jgi:hypothetical protein
MDPTRTVRVMEIGSVPQVATLAAAGVAAGLWLLARGLGGYRTATRLGDTATSRIGALAAGEVRISGAIEPAELTLVSPLQSARCVHYRATIDDADDGPGVGPAFAEERAVGFVVRDGSGSIRVFPRGARWDALLRLDERTGTLGDEPTALDLRVGSAFGPAEHDRASAIAALLSVRPAGTTGEDRGRTDLVSSLRGGSRRRRYREARLEPGDAVTILGRALPFSELADPAEADVADGRATAGDVEVMADLAEARAAGRLAASPEEAWGNAAIPGFGIGRPVRAPEIDPAATAPTLADPAEQGAAERRFSIAPEALVLASSPDAPLLIAHGMPGAAVERHQDRFIMGLLGAVLAIASAMALAVIVAGGSGS